MSERDVQVVTGAFGYTGKYIARTLLEDDRNTKIRTLTSHPKRENPFGQPVEIIPYHFNEPQKLVSDLRGVKTVFNTYWVRFNYGETTFGQAVANVQNLIRAAAEAGVKRFVHISITNPDIDSPFSYFKGKAIMEQTLIESGLSYAIIRPTLIFGKEDILINNIAWILRRFPVYAVFGDGEYRVQPVYVGDLAKLAVELSKTTENIICDAVGPETYTFRGLVNLIKKRVGSRAKIVNTNPKMAFLISKILNLLVRDVVVTREEIYGLMADTIVSNEKPRCSTSFSNWLEKNADLLGTNYVSELNRHFKKINEDAGYRISG